MQIWSLTQEKVDKLLKEKAAKEVELNNLLMLSAKDLWNEDLDEFEAEWNKQLAADEAAARGEVARLKKGPNKGKGVQKKLPVKKMKKVFKDDDLSSSPEPSEDDSLFEG